MIIAKKRWNVRKITYNNMEGLTESLGNGQREKGMFIFGDDSINDRQETKMNERIQIWMNTALSFLCC